MGDHTEKNNESEDESEITMSALDAMTRLAWALERISKLDRRVKALEEEMIAMKEGDNTGFRHQNDGGWFD